MHFLAIWGTRTMILPQTTLGIDFWSFIPKLRGTGWSTASDHNPWHSSKELSALSHWLAHLKINHALSPNKSNTCTKLHGFSVTVPQDKGMKREPIHDSHTVENLLTFLSELHSGSESPIVDLERLPKGSYSIWCDLSHSYLCLVAEAYLPVLQAIHKFCARLPLLNVAFEPAMLAFQSHWFRTTRTHLLRENDFWTEQQQPQ